MLRYSRDRVHDLQVALVAFGDQRYGEALERDFNRAKSTLTAIDELLEKLPPEIPMTAEQEAKVGRVVAAALNKRFGGGDETELDAALDDWLEPEAPPEEQNL